MLNIIDLHFNYAEKKLLNHIQINVPSGVLLHIKGDNGCGKTTLLKLLTGLIQPERGEIHYHGHRITDDLSHYQQQLSYVGHKTGVNARLTLEEHYRFELQRTPHSPSLSTLLQQLNLTGLENTPCGLLSQGQRRRVSFMHLLLRQTPLWILDEPFVSLDHMSIELLMHHICHHIKQGGLLVMTSHQHIPSHDINVLEYQL